MDLWWLNEEKYFFKREGIKLTGSGGQSGHSPGRGGSWWVLSDHTNLYAETTPWDKTFAYIRVASFTCFYCVWVGVYVPPICIYEGQSTQYSLFSQWVSRIKLGSLDLAKYLYPLSHLTGPTPSFKSSKCIITVSNRRAKVLGRVGKCPRFDTQNSWYYY